MAHISTHAPHTRSDRSCRASSRRSGYFNPRPSYEERPCGTPTRRCPSDFNPRPSYEERLRDRAFAYAARDFNPRPSYEERLVPLRFKVREQLHFNPRPSYEERLIPHGGMGYSYKFQPTPLIRGATHLRPPIRAGRAISTHAPHTRSDWTGRPGNPGHRISTHAPHTRSDRYML